MERRAGRSALFLSAIAVLVSCSESRLSQVQIYLTTINFFIVLLAVRIASISCVFNVHVGRFIMTLDYASDLYV